MFSTSNKSVHFSEKLAIVFSVLCAIHCAITPVLLLTASLVPSLTLVGQSWFNIDETIEWILIAIAALFGFINLIHGYQKHHHQILPLLLFSSGIIVFVLHQLLESSLNTHIFIALLANVLMLTAQIINIYFSRKSTCSH